MRLAATRLAIAGALVGVTMTACGGGSSEATSPTPAESTSDTADPATKTPTSTSSTEGATGSTQRKATAINTPSEPKARAVKAFVHRFVKVDNRATRTGHYSRRDTMVDNHTCDDCRESKEYARRIYGNGGKIEGGLFTHSKITVTGTVAGRYFVDLDTVLSAYKSYNGSGDVTDSAPDQHEIVHYTVMRQHGHWTIVHGHTEMTGSAPS
ncbi:MAG: hypothetical protein ACRDMV_07110 [Streptosporangiales bacterium]